MNRVILMGRLTKNPEIKYAGKDNDMAVARYTLAVNRRYKRDGEQEADFISCVTFGKSAEFAQKYLRKGIRIVIGGRISTGSYFVGRDADGIPRYAHCRGTGEIKYRGDVTGSDLSRVMVIDDTEEALTLSDDRIEKAVRQNHVRLVIIDPVQAFIGADELLDGKEGKATETKLERGAKLIKELLADKKEISIGELDEKAKEQGISGRTMRDVRSRMKNELEYQVNEKQENSIRLKE